VRKHRWKGAEIQVGLSSYDREGCQRLRELAADPDTLDDTCEDLRASGSHPRAPEQ
jgi:hypothetical protein